jgi:ferredoxin
MLCCNNSHLLMAAVMMLYISTADAFLALAPSIQNQAKMLVNKKLHLSTPSDDEALDAKLLQIAQSLKLEIFDLDEGLFGFDSRDNRYGLEVVKTKVSTDGGLGLVLTEMAGNVDGRGLVLISEVSGNAAKASPPIQVGDVLIGVIAPSTNFRERTTGLNYDRTIEAIGRAKEAATDGILMLEINRLVKRAEIVVEVQDSEGNIREISTLAGENLRRLLLRKGIKLYDTNTRRFDMPFAKGDCAGEGLCGTCLVEVQEGEHLLSPKDSLEELITKGRPLKWRATCRTVVGPDNKPGCIRLRPKPQTQFADEINPGVKSVN